MLPRQAAADLLVRLLERATLLTQPWLTYFDAAERKAAIARYHVKCLAVELKHDIPSDNGRPSVPVQAHFEGVVIATMAAVDQVAQGVNSALGLGLSPSELVTATFGRIASVVPAVRKWFNDSVGLDLRRLRTRIIHYAYDKQPGRLCWLVEATESDYSGSRELLSYAESAVDYGERLIMLFPEIRHYIETAQAT